MRAQINGETREIAEGATVADVVAMVADTDVRGIAVALDGIVVTRGVWPTTVVLEGARLEVLSAAGGG